MRITLSTPVKPPAVEIAADAPIPSGDAPKNPKEVLRKLIEFDPREEMTITRTWDRPVLEQKKLGSIPSDYYEYAWSYPQPGWGYWPSHERTYGCYGDSCENGPVSVYRDIPVYDEAGNPRKEAYTQTLTEKTYDQKASFFTGGGLGLALGAGAAAGILAAVGGFGASTLVVSGLVGGALGAAAGAAIGFKATDNDKIEEVWYQDDISHPTMTGYTERVSPDVWHEQRCHEEKNSDGTTRTECETWSHLRGYDHDFYPNISWRKVGDYTYPTLQHTARVGPVWGGVLAGAAGAGLGGLVALAVTLL